MKAEEMLERITRAAIGPAADVEEFQIIQDALRELVELDRDAYKGAVPWQLKTLIGGHVLDITELKL